MNSSESSSETHPPTLLLRRVPAKAGWQWITRGLQLLRAHPWDTHMAAFFFLGALSICAIVPLLGSILAALLMPGLYLGVMTVVSGKHIAASDTPQKSATAVFTAMTASFRSAERAKPLMILGALYAAAVTLAIGAYALFDGGAAFGYLVQGTPLPEDERARADAVLGMAGVMGFYAPVAAAFWFTQQLVGWHEQSLGKALFFSWVACWRNMAAFAVFALAWLAIYLLSSGLLVGLTVALGITGMLPVLVFPMTVFFMVWTFASFYASYESVVEVAGVVGVADADKIKHTENASQE